MFEAKLAKASTFKKILESIKDLVTDANFDCTTSGISLQAMDSAHVSLVSLLLRADSFDHYRCDRNLSLGINLNSMTNILKCAGNDDSLTIKADDNGDNVTFIFQSKSMYWLVFINLLEAKLLFCQIWFLISS
jgi:proliferating cell nuclear antigen